MLNTLFLTSSSPPPVTAKFDHQLVRPAPLVLGSPLQFQSLLGVALQLQSVAGGPGDGGGSSGGGGSGGGRHGVGRAAVRLRPVHLRLQARQLPAQPQAHPQDRRLQVSRLKGMVWDF